MFLLTRNPSSQPTVPPSSSPSLPQAGTLMIYTYLWTYRRFARGGMVAHWSLPGLAGGDRTAQVWGIANPGHAFIYNGYIKSVNATR